MIGFEFCLTLIGKKESLKRGLCFESIVRILNTSLKAGIGLVNWAMLKIDTAQALPVLSITN